MLDIILDSFGFALVLGQAVHFCLFADPPLGPALAARSVIPRAGVFAPDQPGIGHPQR